MKTISTFIIAFLIISFFFLASPEKGYSGVGLTSLGCCVGDDSVCVGCDGSCAITNEQCSAEGGTFSVKPDVSTFCSASGMFCNAASSDAGGCCVLSEGNCETQLELTECEIQQGIEWFFDTECSEIPLCKVRVESAVPTLSEWGLIAMAGILGIVGFIVIRRKKITA